MHRYDRMRERERERKNSNLKTLIKREREKKGRNGKADMRMASFKKKNQITLLSLIFILSCKLTHLTVM